MRQFVLFILIFLSIGINAQKYNDSNVHYYLPVGFSVEDVGKTVYNGCALRVDVIVKKSNGIYRTITGNFISSVMRNREKLIKAIQESISNLHTIYSYNSKLSTSKYDVYCDYIPPSMFGSGRTIYCAISKNYKEYIRWDDMSGADNRERYYEIDIETLLPKSAESYDFLE